MPTPVSVARQCLTAEAAHALDESVAVARRRGHSQTTSLHAVSALLSLPSSALRDACARSRNSAYSQRLQFKALELCLGVSLDRIQSGQPGGSGSNDPPVSNSLMAAIKRSQAHQRRLPESFRMYHEISQQNPTQNTISCVKVELRQLILSILDDPVVSRVFGEAGFRSSEIKLSIIRPIPHVLRYPSPRVPPPLFFCNVKENPEPGLDSGMYPGRREFSHPYPGFAGFFHEDGNNMRIGEVLAREKRRNPLLMGVSAHRALIDFVHSIEKRKDAILPKEINGLNVINFENEISDQSSGNLDKERIGTRFKELVELVETNSGLGLLINYGDLSAFTNTDEGENGGLNGREFANYIVGRLSELLQRYANKVWLIGAAPCDEVYCKFLRRFPSVEKDWDLQVLTITSLRPCLAEKSYHKSSLMESFVPFGGFFSTASELKAPILGSCRDENRKPELVGLRKGGLASFPPDQYQSGLPSWLQIPTEAHFNRPFGSKTQEGVSILGGKTADSSYSLTHQEGDMHGPNMCQATAQFPKIMGFKVIDEKKENALDTNKSFVSEQEVLKSAGSFSGSTGSAKSVTTDLGLGICSVSTNSEVEKRKNQNQTEIARTSEFAQSQSSASSCPDIYPQFDPASFKMLFRTLTERVGWQDEAVRVISHKLLQRQTNNTRGDVWFSFMGSDTLGKKRIALALSQRMYQSGERLITIDLGSLEMNGRDLTSLRGKTVADFIFEELYRNPFRVVFLENLNEADDQLQTSLSMAVQTGKFPDSHSREVSIGNTIFVTTLMSKNFGIKPSCYYSEEKILGAKSRQIEISIEHAVVLPFATSISSPSSVNKRKLLATDRSSKKSEITETTKRSSRKQSPVLDLNLPAQENESEGDRDRDQAHENSSAWLKNFMNHSRVVNVTFKPFEFDRLAERITKDINETFHKFVKNPDCSMEIDPKIVEQLLAAAYYSDRNSIVEDWLDKVLSRGFAEVQNRYNFGSGSVLKLVARVLGPVFEEQTRENVLLPNKIVIS